MEVINNNITSNRKSQSTNHTKKPTQSMTMMVRAEIEKVLYKHGIRVRVKWIGFDEAHNSWVNVNEIVQ